jgi:hypothetical protein
MAARLATLFTAKIVVSVFLMMSKFAVKTGLVSLPAA